MLFHATMARIPEDGPGYHPESVPALSDADASLAVARRLTSIPLRQDFKTTPVVRQGDLAAALRQAAG